MFRRPARPEAPDGPKPVDGIAPADGSEPPRRDQTNTLRYGIIATVVGFLLVVEVMALGGVLDGLSNIGVFRMIEGPSCGLTSFGQDL